MKIGSCISKPGKITEGSLRVASISKTDVYIPIQIAEGKKKGATIFLSGGQHGDEINGIGCVHKFIESLDVSKLKGRVIFLPIINITGFKAQKREVQYDGKDLNRCFGVKKRSASYQIANTILEEVISQCIFGIDCHDSGNRATLLPHSRVHKKEETGCTKEMGFLFGTEIVMERQGKRGMMAVAATKKYNVPILTSETGGGLIFWPDYVQEGVRGIFNVLKAHAMYPGRYHLPKKQYFLEEREGYKSPIEGVAHWAVELGQKVHKGDSLVKIYNPIHAEHKEIRSKHCGIVFQKKVQSRVKRNERIIDILQLKYCKTHKTKKARVEEIKHGKNIEKALFTCKLF